MERESFEDSEVAEILNDYFVSIKVDREERPDVDHIYMSVCQAMTGHGGWPLTIIMAPDKKPFFAGTYFPKYDRYGISGLISILKGTRTAWVNRKDELQMAGEKITEAIRQETGIDNNPLQEKIIHDVYRQLKRSFDPQFGGFGNTPKFPTPHNLFFLLRYWYATGETGALSMVEKTLDCMSHGGIYDHIGFGFCRYSTDRQWLVPHFEKMLYDNAFLSMAYLEAYQATGNQEYSRIAAEIFFYIKRDMTSSKGGFYSAEDADSEGEEGLFYIWKPDEVIKILGKDDGKRFCELYDITPEGNFDGGNIPNLIISNNYDGDFVEKCRERLFAEREKRVHPFKDDKILTAWNALMAASFAMGGRILKESAYTEASINAITFIENELTRRDGRLLARYRENEAAIPAYLEDYAFLVWAYLELYQTTYEPDYLKKSVDTCNAINHLFFDGNQGGFYLYGKDAEELIIRPKDAYDGAIPSGNSVMAMNLLRLFRLTGDPRMMEDFERQLAAFRGMVIRAPLGYTHMLTAYLVSLQPSQEVILVSDEPDNAIMSFIEVLRNRFRPFTTSIHYDSRFHELDHIVPYITDYSAPDGKPHAYICKNHACLQPISDVEVFRQVLS